MIDFKSKPYMAKLMHLFEDYVDMMVLLEDVKAVLDSDDTITVRTISASFDLQPSDLQESLESVSRFKQKQLEELEKQIRVFVYGPENAEVNDQNS